MEHEEERMVCSAPTRSEKEEDERDCMDAQRCCDMYQQELFDSIPVSVKAFMEDRIQELIPIMNSNGRARRVDEADVSKMIRNYHRNNKCGPHLLFVTELTLRQQEDILTRFRYWRNIENEFLWCLKVEQTFISFVMSQFQKYDEVE
jgi:hypothetical protein